MYRIITLRQKTTSKGKVDVRYTHDVRYPRLIAIKAIELAEDAKRANEPFKIIDVIEIGDTDWCDIWSHDEKEDSGDTWHPGHPSNYGDR